VFAATVVAVVFTCFVGSLTRQDRPTQAGADLAAQARSGISGGAAWSPGAGTAPPVLHLLAVAVAAHARVPLAGETTVRVYRYAVDDGQQTWCGEVGQADFARIRVGDMVQVQAEPRSRTVTSVQFSPAAPGRP